MKSFIQVRNKILNILNPVKVNESPIFILGKEKSGTTAIASILAIYANLTITSDIPPLWGIKEVMLSNKHLLLSDFINQFKKYFSTDLVKEPSLTFLYTQLKYLFPQAKYAMIVRDPRDNIRSILDHLALTGKEQIDVGLIDSIPYKWRVVFDNRWLGVHSKNTIEQLAHRWNIAVDYYLNNSEEMYLLRYEDFLSDKYAAIEKLAENLNLIQKSEIKLILDYQYQPRGINRNKPINSVISNSNLDIICRICCERMRALKYIR